MGLVLVRVLVGTDAAVGRNVEVSLFIEPEIYNQLQFGSMAKLLVKVFQAILGLFGVHLLVRLLGGFS